MRESKKWGIGLLVVGGAHALLLWLHIFIGPIFTAEQGIAAFFIALVSGGVGFVAWTWE